MNIKVFIGQIGSGKDYRAKEFIKKGYKHMAFADKLRKMLWVLIGWEPKSESDYEKFKKSTFINEMGISFTGRDLLQRFGTDIVRNMINEDFWANNLVYEIYNTDRDKNIVITDCRFENELDILIDTFSYHRDISYQIIFCDYKRNMKEWSNHDSEKMAHRFSKEFKDGEDITEKVKELIDD